MPPSLIAANAFLVRVVRPQRHGSRRSWRARRPSWPRTGRWLPEALRHEGVRQTDMEAALRRQNAYKIDDVDQVKLEPGGTIVVDLRPELESATRADIARLEAKLDRLLGGPQRIAPGAYAAASGWRATTASTRRTTAWVCERAAPVNSIGSRDQGVDVRRGRGRAAGRRRAGRRGRCRSRPWRISSATATACSLIASCAASRPTPPRTAAISTLVVARNGR